jgi:hypothetical protein
MTTLRSINVWIITWLPPTEGGVNKLSRPRSDTRLSIWYDGLAGCRVVPLFSGWQSKRDNTSMCIPTFPGFPPRRYLLQQGDHQRDSYRGEQRRVHSVLVFRREIEQCQHPRVEECARGER